MTPQDKSVMIIRLPTPDELERATKVLVVHKPSGGLMGSPIHVFAVTDIVQGGMLNPDVHAYLGKEFVTSFPSSTWYMVVDKGHVEMYSEEELKVMYTPQTPEPLVVNLPGSEATIPVDLGYGGQYL